MVNFRKLFVLLVLPAMAGAAELPRLAVECEQAQRLRGPSWLCRDAGASRSQCVELMGERAQAFLEARVARSGPYIAWVRARAASDDPAALTLCHEGAQPLNAALDGQDWQWVRLGRLSLDRGPQGFRFTVTGTVRLDQLVLAGDPDFAPAALADTSASLKAGRPEVYFADDFMRSKREAGPWQAVSGSWTVRELKVREQFDASRSANAFSYLGIGAAAQPALAVTGYPLWRNYSIEAAIRSLGGGAIGLVALRQDDRNYYLLRYDPARCQVELIRCLDGVTDQLDSRPGTLRVNQWYLFGLEACDGELIARIDGHEVLRAVDHTFLQGQPGLWSADERGAFFDDVLVRSDEFRVERFEDPALPAWEASGEWAVADGGLAGQGRLLSHEGFGDFEAAALLDPGSREAGVVFDWQGATQHALVSVGADPPRIELREVRDLVPATLASAPLPPAAMGEKPRRLALSYRDGCLTASLDGATVLRAFRPSSGQGRIGLFAAGEGARFRGFEIARAQSPPPARIHNRVFAGEDTMAAWASAESDWQVASPNGRTIAWHKIEHWGDCAVRYEWPEAAPLPGKLGMVVRGDGRKADSGYQLLAEPQAKGPAKLTLLRCGQAIASAIAPAAAGKSIELRWVADSAVALADDKLLLWHRDPSPPAGRLAALWAAGWTPALGETSVRSSNLLDDYFEAAPVDWRTESGDWEMQNRWTCSPQWSWYGGSSDDAAMLWCKQAFRGDVTVHFFAAFQMKTRGSRIYRPADLNVSICADGRNPASGYTFVYGGWNNLATSLLRREKTVATTEKVALRPPTLLDTTPHYTELHRKWWHIAIEKHGPKIACYVDDKLAFEYTDPEPLGGHHVCIWTYDNSVMIARAWIAYERGLGRETPLAAPEEPPVLPGAPPARITSSHKVIFHDFDSGLGKWAGSPGSSTVRIEPRGAGFALGVTNPHAGGSFDLVFPFPAFDAMEYPRLTLDYRLPPAARLNLDVKMSSRPSTDSARPEPAEGRHHAILLTNPQARPAGVPTLGTASIQADDAWHTADIDLRALLLRCYPSAKTLPVEEVALRASDNRNYLDAGFGGNYAGLTYRLDNVRLWSPGPPDVRFSWDPKLPVSFVLDRSGATVPDGTVAGANSSEHQGLAEGPWFFHIKSRDAQGAWSRVAHVPIVVDASPPRIVAMEPAPGSRSPAHLVALDLADESGIAPGSLSVSFLGQEHPAQVVPSDPAASFTPAPVTFDPVTKRVTVDIAGFPMELEDGQELKLRIAQAKDFLGHAMRPAELVWQYDRSQDKQPPHGLRLEGSHPTLCDDDFETGLGQWAASAASTIIERDASTAAEGRYSLRIYNALAGGPFAVTVRSAPFDAGHYPLVSFDYKVPPNVRADLVLTLAGAQYTVRFTDPYGTNCIGAIPDVRADDQWHHTEFNLHEMLIAAVPKAASYAISTLQFADTGFQGNADGVEYHMDNFSIAPAVSTRSAPLEWRLAATAPSGIRGYQYSLTSIPAVFRWVDAAKPVWQFRNIGSGIFHFLVRAQDGAGNWSAPLHRQVLVDDEPPAIASVEPKPGARSADAIIRVALSDSPSGIDRDKLVLTVAGTPYRTSDPGVTYDARTHTLTWSAPHLAKPVTFPNGVEVPVQLDAQDNVGNAACRQWSWKMDYSLDKTPPPAPYVACVPSESLVRMTFEEDVGGWAPYSSYALVDRVTTTAATGRYSLRIVATGSERYFGAYAHRTVFDATKHPIISFDYKMPAGVAIDLHVHDNTTWKTIKLTSPAAYYPVIGAVPVAADDAWHHAQIDLRQFLKDPTPKTPGIPIRYVLFADFASRTNRAGATFHVDNFTIGPPETGQNLRFEWNSVADPTGIPGYAYALDKNPATVPGELRGPANVAAFPNTAPGAWFFHLRARDGAGNWGPVTHFPVIVPNPPK